MSGGKGGGGGGVDMQDVTQTTKIEMPPWLDSAFRDLVSDAQSLQQRQQFPSAGYVPLSDPTLTGLTTMQGLAMDPSQIPGYGGAFDVYNRTLQGDYLYGGEGFNAAMDAAERSILPRVKSTFGTSGRTGSALAEAAMAEELGDVFAGMYQTERGRQDAAYRALPMMYQTAMAPGQTMLGVGQVLEDEQQRELADQMAKWAFHQDEPYQLLARRAGLITPGAQAYAGQSTTSQLPVYESGGAGLLGSALSLGSMFMPGGGIGGLLGGGLGAVAAPSFMSDTFLPGGFTSII